jgi:MSHA pilin protein MshC
MPATPISIFRRQSPGHAVAGFSLVELITTLILVGILAVVAIPRLVGVEAYNTRAFSDRVLAGLRYAQKQAIAKRRKVCVSVLANSVTFQYASVAGAAAACDLPLAGPGGVSPFVVMAESSGAGNVVLAPVTTFSFNALGRPSTGQVFTVTGDSVVTIRVESETGYVHG